MQTLSQAPWHAALYLGPASTPAGHGVVVTADGARRVVSIMPGIDGLQTGDDVLLSADRNAIMARSNGGGALAGEIAAFVRYTPDGRLLLRHRDEEVIAGAAAWLEPTLRPGQRVRWDRRALLVLERVDEGPGPDDPLEETPTEAFAQIGGLDAQIDQLTSTLALRLDHRDVAARYGVTPPAGALLAGPPGTGKTLLARAFGHWLASRVPAGRSRFLQVKPSQLLSKWFGESEQRVRNVFARARGAAAETPGVPVVLFLDEVDALGATRGDWGQRYNDQVLTSLLAELTTTSAESGVFVLAATNRLEALDPALTRPGGRLGDCVVVVPRPRRAAARAVLDRHLPPPHAFAADPDGREPAEGRRLAINAAVSAVYAPNALGTLAHVTLRDGTRRAIGAADLVSGAVLASIARAACEQACRRELAGGRPGIGADDLRAATAQRFADMARALTPRNVRHHVDTLPQDLDPVRVEIVRTPSWPSTDVTAE